MGSGDGDRGEHGLRPFDLEARAGIEIGMKRI